MKRNENGSSRCGGCCFLMRGSSCCVLFSNQRCSLPAPLGPKERGNPAPGLRARIRDMHKRLQISYANQQVGAPVDAPFLCAAARASPLTRRLRAVGAQSMSGRVWNCIERPPGPTSRGPGSLVFVGRSRQASTLQSWHADLLRKCTNVTDVCRERACPFRTPGMQLPCRPCRGGACPART